LNVPGPDAPFANVISIVLFAPAFRLHALAHRARTARVTDV
jgi:hypothetical protein